MFVCFVPKVLRGEACPHLRVDNDPQLRVSAPARGTSANIQIHRDSGNCLIGLGALLRRIKQSQGMSPSGGGSGQQLPEGRFVPTIQDKPLPKGLPVIKPGKSRPLRPVFRTVHCLLEFYQVAHFVCCTGIFPTMPSRQVGWVQAVEFLSNRAIHTAVVPSALDVSLILQLNLTWFRNISLHLHPLVGGDCLLGLGGVVPVV